MKPKLAIIGILMAFSGSGIATTTETTHRTPEFSNDKVNVWKTVLLPTQSQQLQMHHHDHDRVLVALTDGKIKILDNKGQIGYLDIKKDHAYFLPKNPADSNHTDTNMGDKPIEVIVVELK